ncbi:hypothetical protein WJX77_004485 [Trebouxia sp. C0004]
MIKPRTREKLAGMAPMFSKAAWALSATTGTLASGASYRKASWGSTWPGCNSGQKRCRPSLLAIEHAEPAWCQGHFINSLHTLCTSSKS